VTVMILLNAIAWWMAVTYATWILGPGLKEISKGMGEAWRTIREMVNDIGL
jgi:hypothetical protein